MTLAICLQCGAEKLGALTLCSECGSVPSTADERARSLALSDHNLSADELRAIAAKIRAGESPSFDEASIAEVAGQISMIEDSRMPIGCHIAVWTPIVVLIVLVVVLILLWP